jgi:DNA-binding transcriptional LysR family regulator
MTRPPVELDRLAIFVAVAEAGGFTAAASRLGVTKAMISQQVGRLEAELAVTLFTRTTRQVVLTPEGSELLAECGPLLARLREAVARVGAREASLSGRLRITVGVDHLNAGFAEPLAEFARLHPELRLDVLATDAVLDLVGHGVDVAIRRGWLKDSSLTAASLGEFEQWVLASPEYLRRAGRPAHPRQLREHRCIAFSALQRAARTWHFTGAGGAKVSVRVGEGLLCSSPLGVLALARAGGGVAALASSSAAEDVTRGALVRLLTDWRLPKAGVYVVYPATKHLAPPTRAFVDFLRERYTGFR